MIKRLKKIWTHSIQRQLIITIAFIHAVLMTIFVFDLVHRQSDFLEKQSQNHALGLCKTIATNSVSWVLAQDLVGMEEIILSQSQHPELLYAMLISPHGKIMAHTEDNNIGLFLSDSISLSLLKKDTIPQILVNNSRLIDIASPILANGKFIGWARVGMSQQSIYNGLVRIAKDGIWYTIIAIIVGSVFAIIMGRSITSGLRHLVKVANEIRDGNEDERVTFKRSDELGNLGKNLNLMIDSMIKQKNIIIETQKELKASEQKLKIQNEELDIKVEERTKELKENEKRLKELNATKDKLFSIIAHDLKSPVSSLYGFSDVLLQNISTNSVEKTSEFIRYINSTTKQTLNLLDNLLDWSKAQTGQLDFNPENLNLHPLIQETIEVLNISAALKKITIECAADNTFVYADRKMLETVIRNLVSNAIKFTNTGGRIQIDAVLAQNQVEISVSDNGVGMNEETISKLFRIDTAQTTEGTSNEKGSGLGLILCKEFVEKQGGKIWVESKVGKGSEFKFTVPVSN